MYQSGLFQNPISSVPSEELTLPRSARCALSGLRCNFHSTLLGTYLHRVGRAKTPLCSNCGSKSQDLSISCWTALYLTLCVGPSSTTPSLFGTSGPIRANYWDSAKSIRAPSPEMGRVNPPPPPQFKVIESKSTTKRMATPLPVRRIIL